MVLLRVCVFILPEHSPLSFIPLTFPLCTASEASGAICQFCVRVCPCAHPELQKESILCKSETEQGKKAEGGCERKGGEGGGMEMIPYVRARVYLRVCVCPPESCKVSR